MSEPSSAVHGVSEAEMLRLVHFDHDEPHRILGAHPGRRGDAGGIVIRAFHPDAAGCSAVLRSGEMRALPAAGPPGFFEGFLPGASLPLAYRLRFRFSDGWDWERDDPYRFLPTLGDVDLHLFNEGTHRRLWDVLGAHPRHIDGVEGTSFAVWAPNARRVSVVGDFCRWDGRLYPMRRMGSSGVFELFVPGVSPGAIYKFEIKTREGMLRMKSDPFAFATEAPPQTASRVTRSSYTWGDHAWMARRAQRDWAREPMAIYEAHLGSWMRVPEEGNRPLSYREIAPKLVEHVKRLGFTHIELLPIAEHPFSGSWGYQVTGYYAPTARYGTPDDFRFFVDHCHAHGIGVFLDWVPAHFPKDDWALRRFDGTALYEHDDPRQGEHPDWGTLIFNFDRSEVRNFLVANALYWLEEFHVDGLRVDAVASMLYLDYSRQEGEWIPNRYGGRENLGAIDFLKDLNETVRREQPGTLMIAEESTAWPRVTGPVPEGGLGFSFKWNMGWMHDTLKYMSHDPIHRRFHHDTITFAMLYEFTERFINPLSHDEVVHMKGSLWNKMPGDPWQKFANLRLLLAYQFTRPGKKMLFMGAELGTWREWNHDASLDWHFGDEPERAGILRFVEELGRIYHEYPCLWRRDTEPEGFRWIDCSDRDNSTVFYLRLDGDDHVVVALNFTPVPREHYRIGVPASGRYVERLSTDDPRFAGSGFGTHSRLVTEPFGSHGYPQSLVLRIPPLGALILVPERQVVPADPPDPPDPPAAPPQPTKRPAAKRSPRKSA